MAKGKEKEKALAKELYLQTNKTLEQIAEIVLVSRLTISTWAKDGKWKSTKDVQAQTPEKIVQALYAEVEQLNKNIAGRKDGFRFADSKESDARNKIILSIVRMKNNLALPQFVAVLYKFLDHVQSSDLELSKKITPIANDFINDMASVLTATD
jgi:transposase